MDSLAGRRVLVGVSGGIAAYKTPDLVRRLKERGAEVRVAMTPAACEFVTPLTFQAVSGRPVHLELLDERAEAAMGHIELARWAEMIVVAPASADLLARIAAGMADDLLTTLILASEAPLLLAPAMNRVMWAAAATQANCRVLAERGAELLGPALGDQACGEVGPGRMLEPGQLAEAVADRLARSDLLAERAVLVSAGPTFEDLDPVRYLGNRSSGRMGFAIARAARNAGATVTLVAGPVCLPTPLGIERVDVRSAREMREAIMARIAATDVYVGAAAVADFRPAEVSDHKIKKGARQDYQVALELNPDILAEVAALPDRPLTVGFAAETDDVEKNARVKLKAKGVDLIATHRVGGPECGFDGENNALTVLWDGGRREFERQSKERLAVQLIALVAERLRGSDAERPIENT